MSRTAETAGDSRRYASPAAKPVPVLGWFEPFRIGDLRSADAFGCSMQARPVRHPLADLFGNRRNLPPTVLQEGTRGHRADKEQLCSRSLVRMGLSRPSRAAP